jgi:hypothetical protein
MSASSPDARRWASRFAWLLLLWGAGVVGLGIIAAVLHGLMAMAGLTSG